jgi:capsular exopolysaccharide synthesis family protein
MMSKSSNSKTTAKKKVETSPVGPQLNFSGKEAYKLLRTNLLFTVTHNSQGARMVGVTSSVSGEGKSLTSINMAYTMAETGLKILLIECDLRKPTLGTKLGITSASGLSNVLARLSTPAEMLNRNVLIKGLDVILAGDIPPNPAELLGSKAMGFVLDKMGTYYDYIVLDLPPVGSVTDALVVSKHLDGVVVVARQNYTTTTMLADTVRQLKYVDAHILGFVYNDASANGAGYGQYRKYKKYGSYS